MNYFHLTPDKQTRGPYSAAEMRALHASGAIDDDTLAAAAGDAGWRPYRELTLADGVEPPPIGPRTLGNCPFCGQEIVDTATPAACPHCGKTLHPGTGNLWFNFLSCLRRYACFRGRATRTEFWSFYLFFYIISMVCNYLCQITMAGLYDIPADLEQQLHAADDVSQVWATIEPYLAGCGISVGIQLLVALLFTLPYWGVTVRRLHDTGRSAAAFVWNLIGWVMCCGGLGYFVWLLFAAGWDEEVMELMVENDIMLPIVALGALLLGFLIMLISGLYMLVCFLLPTKQGGNKYGPSL
ncbi:MAG: DUF805 domain-containing protein [Akkermansia sp.]|nr:DUF805 domain-containing protein [Akkermansia sp.]